MVVVLVGLRTRLANVVFRSEIKPKGRTGSKRSRTRRMRVEKDKRSQQAEKRGSTRAKHKCREAESGEAEKQKTKA